MTIQEKKDYLSQYRRSDIKINSLICEQSRLKSMVCGMSPQLSDMPKGGNGEDRLQRGVEQILELEEQINGEIERLISLREDICQKIETIKDPKQRAVIRFRYLNGFTWEKIAVEMDLTYQWVCALHGRALQEIILEN